MKTALLFFMFAAAPVVENALVKVTDETIKPGETVTWPGGHPTEFVYFTEGTWEFRTGARAHVRQGQAVYELVPERTVKNAGTADIHYARIEFLGKGSSESWGKAGLAPNYKFLFENQYERVYEIRIPAGMKEEQHTHHDRVVVCLSGAQLKHVMPDGREESSTLKTGEIAWRKGGTHVGQNLGKTDLWVVAVEPK
jgi:hypothetical protein